MSDLFIDKTGVYLETVSLGKGYVSFRVQVPPMAKRNPHLKKEYDDLDEACRDLKRFLGRDEVDPETVLVVEKQCPEGHWGSERS